MTHRKIECSQGGGKGSRIGKNMRWNFFDELVSRMKRNRLLLDFNARFRFLLNLTSIVFQL